MSTSSTFFVLLASTLSIGCAASVHAIEVFDVSSGCFEPAKYASDYEWRPVQGGYTCDGHFVPQETIEELIDRLTGQDKHMCQLLEELGITDATLQDHRQDIMKAAYGSKESTLDRVDAILSSSALVPAILAHALGRDRGSTVDQHFRVRLPLMPEVVVESRSEAAYMLPWTVASGAQSWQVQCPGVSLMLLDLAKQPGNNADAIDGRRYWQEEFWHNSSFWRHFAAKIAR